jgi:hypothetical protein
MADLEEHLDEMRMLIGGELRSANRAQFVALMRAHMIYIAAHLLTEQSTGFLDADLFLSETLARCVRSRGPDGNWGLREQK